jgi:hypothetical protein
MLPPHPGPHPAILNEGFGGQVVLVGLRVGPVPGEERRGPLDAAGRVKEGGGAEGGGKGA